MCKVVMRKKSQNIDFIIYNVLFSKRKSGFTTDALLATIQSYDDQISKKILQSKIDALISNGLVRQKVGEYFVVE